MVIDSDAHRGHAGAAPPGMLDAHERVTGRVPYTINISVPGMLHAKLLRSQSAHARLVRVDVSRARALPGVAAVLTGQDIIDRGDIQPRFGPVLRDQPILAMGKVRFVGEPIVAVAAADPDAAAHALDLIEVEYEELEPVFGFDEALAEDAPLVHSEPPHPGPTFADIILHTGTGTNLCNHFKLRKGDIERGFAEAAHIFEDEFTSPAVQHVPLETHACIADWSAGGLSVTASTQIPYMLRNQLAEVFRLPASRVRVQVPTLGGGYGAKCYPCIEPAVAALAKVAGRPVRLVLSREEEFVTITKHAVRVRMKTGLRADGTICARQVTAHFNTGAYADIGPRLIKNGGYGTAGPTDIPHVWIDSYAVYTNLPPAGAFRGYGISQAAWAYETQLDMIAARLGMDPYELRMKNLLEEGQTFATGEVMDACHFKELLGTVAQRIGWDARAAPVRDGSRVRATGLSCIIKGTVTPSTSTAAAKLDEDGSLAISTSSVEMGQGVHTALATLAAERLEVPIDKVHVSFVDTDVTPYDQQTSSSRSTQAMGHAVVEAVDEIRGQLLERASELLEADVGDLHLNDTGVHVKGSPRTAIAIDQVMRRTRSGSLLGRGRFQSQGGLDPETGQGRGAVHWHQAAGAAEVEVDLETGKVDVLRYEAAVYSGRTVNPVQAELQSEGNVAFGLGQALFEELVYDHGQLQNGNLGDYMIASMADMPELGITVLEDRARHEIHGIGETGLPAVMPAIGNAVFRATGVRITDLPITAEKVLRGLRALGTPTPR
ncbi:MAG: xanthine dehydrogenase family protein molybdopterin-binding subunit [Candidatus Limnocylindrales bacterium]